MVVGGDGVGMIVVVMNVEVFMVFVVVVEMVVNGFGSFGGEGGNVVVEIEVMMEMVAVLGVSEEVVVVLVVEIGAV